MGNATSFDHSYSVPVEGPVLENQSATRRCATHPDAVVDGFADCKVTNCWELFQMGVKTSGDNPFLGKRKRDPKTGKLGEFEWISFKESRDLALRIGSALLSLNAVPEKDFPDEIFPSAKKMRLLGMFSKNCVEWFLLEQSANAFGLTIVPLYDTLGPEATLFILNETEMGCVIVSSECLDLLLKSAAQATHLKFVISLGEVSESQLSVSKLHGIELITWSFLLEHSTTIELQKPFVVDQDRVHTLCYTSGTTSNPKGVILTHGNVVACVCASIRGPLSAKEFVVTPEDIHISYLPLAHVFERIICNIVITVGAQIGVFSGDTQKLLDDVKELRPTIFISVPRLFNRINDRVFGGLREKSALAQYLFNSGMNAKLAALRKDGTTTHALWDRLVFNKTKQLMGGRLRYMITGGAPLDAAVQERMKVLFCAPLMEGYGLTESLGASFITSPYDPLTGHVGGPVPCNEFRLESVPEMDYFATATPPRGELLIRGPAICKGYFRNFAENAKSFDDAGWLHTGDIAILLPNGGVKIIDRKKNIFKLAQGEYVAPEKIEGVYQQSLMIAQVFAFGYSTQFVLVGIVVPDPENAALWASRNGKEKLTLAELCNDETFKEAVMADMEATAKAASLKGFEKLKDIFLTPEPFTNENGLLTPTFKLKRHQAKTAYIQEIDKMYLKVNADAQKAAAGQK